jgi:hypothetical protein
MAGTKKFFCEYCKSEVPPDADYCAVCGKKFSAVKCPKCGRTGEAKQFANGCPFCGYASQPTAAQPVPAKPSVILDSTGPQKKAGQYAWLFYAAVIATLGGLAGLLFIL